MQRFISMIWDKVYGVIAPKYKVSFLGFDKHGNPLYVVDYGYPWLSFVGYETNSYAQACKFVKDNSGVSPLAIV